MTDSHREAGASRPARRPARPPAAFEETLCDWCIEPRRPAVDRMEVSNGARDVLLHLDLCDEHAAELSDGGLKRKILKAEKVQRIKASMSS